MFSSGLDKQKKEDWKADGYKWRNNGNKKKTIFIENTEFIIVKKFFNITDGKSNDSRFQKHVFLVESSHHINNFIFIVYYGDESVYVPAPHRNSKKNTPFVPTKKSVIEAIKLEGDSKPVQVQNIVNSKLKYSAKECKFSSVRDDRQVKNVQVSLRNLKKLSHDSLYNLHEIYYHLGGYISDVKLAPDVYVIMGLQEAIDEFDKLLQLKTDETVCLFYDTTFDLGNFYVSTISFQHLMFTENPVIPIAHIIHERKFQKIHENFFQYIEEKIPRLGTKNIAIVTDREQGLINAIHNVFPNLTNLLCWNHIIRDVKQWLRSKGEINENISVYAKQIKKLLECSSEKEYDKLLTTQDYLAEKTVGYRNMWSQLFVEYFDKHLDQSLRLSAVKWVVESFHFFNPYSGITNNAAEAMHGSNVF
mgnify:FL=1